MHIKQILQALKNRQGVTMLESFKQKYTSFQILVSTVMSARTRDTTTIPIAEKLFRTYKTPQDFVNAPLHELEKAMYGIGFYHTKAKNIKLLSEQIIKQHNGEVPKDITKLLSLPGVGRKTANCVLCYAFKMPSIPVDVHVHRISNRIGLVTTKTPEETEKELEKTVPKNLWLDINQLFVTHGQTICLPRNPNCWICPVKIYCSYFLLTPKDEPVSIKESKPPKTAISKNAGVHP